jgi:hypothetical protein
MELYEEQKKAIEKMHNGCVLMGGVGSGKTLTSLSYYIKNHSNLKLYVITTAKKRNTNEWYQEAKLLNLPVDDIVVDSWNNIEKYKNVKDSFFIFDETKISGYGKWAKTFIFIARFNKWILLSATPADVWMDFMTLFIANGFYRNKTDFCRQHVEYDPYVKFPKVKKYHNVDILERHRKEIVVTMDVLRRTIRKRIYIKADYDVDMYTKVFKEHWDPYENEPIENPSQLVSLSRRIVSESKDRQQKFVDILKENDKTIVFYNYNYELEIIEHILESLNIPYKQWNGHKHEDVPIGDKWCYVVHFSAAEAWNCITTNVVIFYSLNYSFRMVEQAEGRIDRINTPYTNLYYYYLYSRSSIDQAILRAVQNKKKFNEASWGKKEYALPKPVPRNVKSERDYQATLIKKLGQKFPSSVVLKNDPTYKQGIPDLLILNKDKWGMLEVKKSENAAHRPNQDYYVNKLDKMGYASFIYPENEKEVLNDLEIQLS